MSLLDPRCAGFLSETILTAASRTYAIHLAAIDRGFIAQPIRMYISTYRCICNARTDCLYRARTDTTDGVHNNHHTNRYVRNIRRIRLQGWCTRSCIYLWKIPRVRGPDAAIRRNRASLQRQRVSRDRGSRIYIRNFRSLTTNTPRLPRAFSLRFACTRSVLGFKRFSQLSDV